MKPTPELVNLVEKSYSQDLNQREVDRLQELLKDKDAMDYYLDIAAQDAGLTTLEKEGFFHAENVVPFIQQFAAPLIGIAAAVMFFVGYMSGSFSKQPEQPHITDLKKTITTSDTKKLAQITSMVGVSWEGSPSDLQLVKESSPLKFTSGLVELTFNSGVKMLLEGPAELRVTGGNKAHLTKGRLVAEVPKGAEGFTVDYHQGKLVDLGTEFAMQINDSNPVEVGVFRGEVEVYTDLSSNPVKVVENHAVQHKNINNAKITSIPFQRSKYVRTLPSSEFAWKFPEDATKGSITKTFDVSHLVWKSGSYHAVVKWMQGRDGVRISGAELFCDDQSIAKDLHKGATGVRAFAQDNVYQLNVPTHQIKRGKWILKIQLKLITPEGELPNDFKADSAGLVLFEEVSKIRATVKDFVGKWEYRHDGNVHQRVFHQDQTASYYLNGVKHDDFDGATWIVKKNVLILTLPALGENRPQPIIERHLMRNKKELIFESLPYRNGKKVQ